MTKTLIECLDSYYGPGNWSQRTGVSQGTDIGPAINSLGVGRSRLYIDPGIWLLTTPIDSSVLSGKQIEGYGSQASLIVYNNTGQPQGTIAFHWSGANGYTGGGMKGVGILLEKDLGDTLCYAIMLRGDSTYQPDQTMFEDLYISSLGNSYWWDVLHVDGSARQAPIGVRVASFHNLQLFNSRNLSAYFDTGIQMDLTNIGCWTSKGDTPNHLVMRNCINMSLRGITAANMTIH